MSKGSSRLSQGLLPQDPLELEGRDGLQNADTECLALSDPLPGSTAGSECRVHNTDNRWEGEGAHPKIPVPSHTHPVIPDQGSSLPHPCLCLATDWGSV